MLSDQLEQSKSNLFDHFNKNYANTNIPAPSLLPSTFVQSAPMAAGSPGQFAISCSINHFDVVAYMLG